MNRFIKITLIALVLVFNACEDVIDVQVQTAPERLIIEASIDWETGTLGNEQSIKLSTSTPFFETNKNTQVTDASVKITNDSSLMEFDFLHQSNGVYTSSNFVPILGESYTLAVNYKGEIYHATETLNAITDITSISQDIEDGYDDEVLEVHIKFTDPIEEGNYNLFKFKKRGELLPELEEFDDEFVNGNEIDWWYEIEEDDSTEEIEAFVPGDIVDIEFYAISEAYYKYISILISQIGGVGLFESTPVSLKGNCINLSNPDNYAYGYFRITQFIKTSYTFE